MTRDALTTHTHRQTHAHAGARERTDGERTCAFYYMVYLVGCGTLIYTKSISTRIDGLGERERERAFAFEYALYV